jgi:radical SAM superfamily enzyme YgiQ (UPF0313 family)
MVIAGLTPEDWEVTIIDENLGVPDYSRLPKPDLVGITAFTSQAERAYALATRFRDDGVPVVMGGIHATMCSEEALAYVDAVVKGEAEKVWEQVLKDVRLDQLKPSCDGGFAELSEMSPARHDLLPNKYVFGSIQTTRGCPLHCSFCSVTAFNGSRFRQRPVKDVIQEFAALSEDLVLIVDDNLIGTRHARRAARDCLSASNLRNRTRQRRFTRRTTCAVVAISVSRFVEYRATVSWLRARSSSDSKATGQASARSLPTPPNGTASILSMSSS